LEITWLEPITVEEEEEIVADEDIVLQDEPENEDGDENEGLDKFPVTPVVVPPISPPEFPDEDDAGTGIQMTLF
jgi:hypothetical protein